MKKNFFLISFLPAILYWYLEENYPVKIAVIGGLALAALEICVEKIWLKHVHKISWFNFFLILVLGGLSIIGDEGIWFKLQPAITGLIIGSLLMISKVRKKSFFSQMMDDFQTEQKPPQWLLELLEFHSGVFFFIYGLWMIFVANKLSTDQWLFFKTAGFYLCFFVFFIFEFIFLRFKIRKMIHQQNH